MAILDKLTKVTQGAVRGAKDFTEAARVNSQIAEEEKRLNSTYTQIGKLYFALGEANPATPIDELCAAATASQEKIAKYKEELDQIKGTKRCDECGAELPTASAFCSACGAKAPVVEPPTPIAEPAVATRLCSGCGLEVPEDAVFCVGCGLKQ